MAIYERGEARIHYDVTGDGFPVLLIAPGGMKSAAALWPNMPWNPLDALAGDYRLIAMDQRNAGGSFAPVSSSDGWDTYTDDQLGLLDHLGVERCHVIGMCIGGPYVLGLLKAAPARFASAVLLQPIGLDENRGAFHEMFDAWADDIAPAHPEADVATFAAFRTNMYDGDFMFNTTRDELADIDTPMLVLMGDDLYHPQSTSRAIAELAPHVTFVEEWKTDDHLGTTQATISTFLATHTPEH